MPHANRSSPGSGVLESERPRPGSAHVWSRFPARTHVQLGLRLSAFGGDIAHFVSVRSGGT